MKRGVSSNSSKHFFFYGCFRFGNDGLKLKLFSFSLYHLSCSDWESINHKQFKQFKSCYWFHPKSTQTDTDTHPKVQLFICHMTHNRTENRPLHECSLFIKPRFSSLPEIYEFDHQREDGPTSIWSKLQAGWSWKSQNNQLPKLNNFNEWYSNVEQRPS